MRFYFFRNRYLFSSRHSLLPGRLRWKFRYLKTLWLGYVGVRHDLESRHVFLSVLTSLVSGSTGAYGDSSSTARAVHRLDTVLTSALMMGSALKRLLPRTKRARL